MLTIENGWFADCRNVCWIIATTERGLLFPALDNRFRKVHLEMYGAEDIARIIQLDHPHWNMPLCQLAASVLRARSPGGARLRRRHGDWSGSRTAARTGRRSRPGSPGATASTDSG